MFERAQYRDSKEVDWRHIKDPVATVKYDGAHFFLQFDHDGSPRFYSRRQSVKGHFPERTDKLPHLADIKLPQYANKVYSVELIHTGTTPHSVESHRRVSGLLNSLPPKSIAEQQAEGPIRAVLIDTIEPKLSTYKDKLLHLKQLEKDFGKPHLMFVPTPVIGHKDIHALIDKTKKQGREGVIITSLETPEEKNKRIKIKHQDHYNLEVIKIQQELDKYGKPKPSAGALICKDATGKEVATVGTGFTPALRKEIWENQHDWIGRLIQVKSMGLAAKRLRMPVYNGDADGALDTVS